MVAPLSLQNEKIEVVEVEEVVEVVEVVEVEEVEEEGKILIRDLEVDEELEEDMRILTRNFEKFKEASFYHALNTLVTYSTTYNFSSGKSFQVNDYEKAFLDTILGKVQQEQYFGKTFSEDNITLPPNKGRRVFIVDNQRIEVNSLYAVNEVGIGNLNDIDQLWIFTNTGHLPGIFYISNNQALLHYEHPYDFLYHRIRMDQGVAFLQLIEDYSEYLYEYFLEHIAPSWD